MRSTATSDRRNMGRTLQQVGKIAIWSMVASMWPAHALTLTRIPIAIAMFWASGLLAVVLVALAALTDALDGNVARWLKRRGHTTPDIGGWLDPLVDKLFVAIVVIALLAVVLDFVWKRMRGLPDASAIEPEPTASAGG